MRPSLPAPCFLLPAVPAGAGPDIDDEEKEISEADELRM